MFVSSSKNPVIKRLGKLNYVIGIFLLWRIGYDLPKIEFYIYAVYFIFLVDYFVVKIFYK